MNNRFVMTRPKAQEFYQGLLIKADTGLHAQAMELLNRFAEPGASVVDVGAGTGAFCRRLADAGYEPTGLDVDDQDWGATEIPLVRHDLNLGIAGSLGRVFDVAVCLEVIEHIENPWGLLRDLRETVRPGGYLILSSPNITSFSSRLTFARTGRFATFGEENLSYGHINPMSEFEIRTVASRTGWKHMATAPAGYLPIFNLTSFHPRKLIENALRIPFLLFGTGRKHGWCLLFSFKREMAGLSPAIDGGRTGW